MLLPETEQAAEDDDAEDDERVHRVSEENRHCGGRQQDQNDRLGELAKQLLRDPGAASRRQSGGSLGGQPFRGLGVRQASRVAAQVVDDVSCVVGPEVSMIVCSRFRGAGLDLALCKDTCVP